MIPQSLRALLEGLVDYAGLFPPARLPLDEAIANYKRHRAGEHSWMLGRFVLPAASLENVPRSIPYSVLAEPALLPAREKVLELKASPIEIEGLDAEGRTIYVEITDPAMLPLLRTRGLRAKLRTGGLTPDAFPSIERVSQFIRAAREAGVLFKATAGLHHPLRCVRALTYEPDAPTGTMHGFLNLFLAAALPEHADGILGETDASAFRFTDEAAHWRNAQVSTVELRRVRAEVATSFGSCSFDEPIEDLQKLGWL